MSSPTGKGSLERPISEIDLSRALQEVQIQAETGLRYTARSLLRLRPEDGKAGDPSGIITPPGRAVPNAPPPTPVTPLNDNSAPTGNGDEKPKGTKNALQELPNGDQPKKKKKKVPNVTQHPVNSIIKGSGFEGKCLLGSNTTFANMLQRVLCRPTFDSR